MRRGLEAYSPASPCMIAVLVPSCATLTLVPDLAVVTFSDKAVGSREHEAGRNQRARAVCTVGAHLNAANGTVRPPGDFITSADRIRPRSDVLFSLVARLNLKGAAAENR